MSVNLGFPVSHAATECASWLPCVRGAVKPYKDKIGLTEGLYPRPVIAFTPNEIRTYLTESED